MPKRRLGWLVARWLVFKPVWIPAGATSTRVGEVVDLRSATQRRFAVEVTVSDVTTTTSNTVAGGSGKRQGMNKIKHT